VRSGSSYISHSDMRLHFGLGVENEIQGIEVRWPSGLAERFPDARADTVITIREGSGEPLRAGAFGQHKPN
jgi:hypothetical protein